MPARQVGKLLKKILKNLPGQLESYPAGEGTHLDVGHAHDVAAVVHVLLQVFLLHKQNIIAFKPTDDPSSPDQRRLVFQQLILSY